MATRRFKRSNTRVLTKPSGLVEPTSRLAASYPRLVWDRAKKQRLSEHLVSAS